MPNAIRVIQDTRVLECAREGMALGGDCDASDLLSESFSAGTKWISIPVERLSEDFFRLRTGLAGAFIQKLTNYRRRLVVVGDVGRWVEQSTAFRDFVFEANKGRQIWFVSGQEEFERKLEQTAAAEQRPEPRAG